MEKWRVEAEEEAVAGWHPQDHTPTVLLSRSYGKGACIHILPKWTRELLSAHFAGCFEFIEDSPVSTSEGKTANM